MTSSQILSPIGTRGAEPRRLGNYVLGQRIVAARKAADLFHALSWDKIAEAATNGIDFKAVADYAKRVGGPTLRKMTFHERELMLKAMAQYLMARKDEFYAVSAAT